MTDERKHATDTPESVENVSDTPETRPSAPENLPKLTESRGGKLGNALVRESYYDHIARLLMAHCSVREIAEHVGLKHHRVKEILDSPEFRTYYDQLRKEVYSNLDEILYDERASIVDRIRAGAPRALTRLFELVESARSEHVRHQAAKDWLGLAGIAPVERRVDASVQLTDFTPEQKEMLTQAITAALGSGDVQLPADVEVTVDTTPDALPNPAETTEDTGICADTLSDASECPLRRSTPGAVPSPSDDGETPPDASCGA